MKHVFSMFCFQIFHLFFSSLFMSLIIMNLMVGLAVDDIAQVRKTAALQRLGMRTKTSLETEFNYLLNLFDMRKKTTRNFINVIPEEVEMNQNSITFRGLFSFFRSEHRLTTEVIGEHLQRVYRFFKEAT